MFPPVFERAAVDSTVQVHFGRDPTRLYPAGEAPAGVTAPYAVWRVISGSPGNTLGHTPDLDAWTVQAEVFAATASAARAAARALRDAVEPVAHIVAWRGESRDVDTRLYRYSFDMDWLVNRTKE